MERWRDMWVQSCFIQHILQDMESGKHTGRIIPHSAHLTVQFVFALLDTKSRKHISTIVFHSACLTYAIRLHSTGSEKWKTYAYPHTPFSMSDFVVQSHSTGYRNWKTWEHLYFIQYVWLSQFVCTLQGMECGKRELIHVSCSTFDVNALVHSQVRRNCIES
jgi:hypothetical protein